MKPYSRLACLVLVSLVALLYGPITEAAAQARFAVSAHVQAVATLTLAAQPAALVLTEEDIRRGAVAIREPTVLLLHSNSAQGVALDIGASLKLFTAVRVQGLDGDATLSGEGGTLTHRWAAPMPLPLSLTFTLYLKPDAKAGTYPWPLALSVRALETL
jgi:hypothetical protein